MSIPKKIHYCWFGQGEIPDLALKCINSWKKHLPDYELVLWNEDTFDINMNRYVKEAYHQKKYAFVTDYVRIFALYEHGGIYMDTDVEILKSLDPFLGHKAFTGCENEYSCVTGLMAAEKKHPWIKMLLDEYRDKYFIVRNGELDVTANTKLITDKTTEIYGWVPKNKYQQLEDGLHIYPVDYFCAKDWRTGKITKTDETFGIHHFAGSWIDKKQKAKAEKKKNIRRIIITLVGEKGFQLIKSFITPIIKKLNFFKSKSG